ncbi:MAG: threonylcarbamoyl-AMP synthase [Methanomicrobiales archaeon]|nr:threonylcarbamoyl-AMP synthase [Methanomicrobiales archaeon]
MDVIAKAVSILMHDGLVVYPTDTLYGLGADAFSDEAIQRVYEAKKRPIGMPISIAVSDFDMLAVVARVKPEMEEFLHTFLPGPVTVILPARNSVPDILTGGTGLIGIRMPSHITALDLIRRFDGPITATSANLHGAKDPQTPDQCTVPHEFLIDGGRLPGTASTVVDMVAKTIIRPGADAEKVSRYLLQLP